MFSETIPMLLLVRLDLLLTFLPQVCSLCLCPCTLRVFTELNERRHPFAPSCPLCYVLSADGHWMNPRKHQSE